MTVLFVIQHWDSMLIMESINNAEVVFLYHIYIISFIFGRKTFFLTFFFILNVIIFVITTL